MLRPAVSCSRQCLILLCLLLACAHAPDRATTEGTQKRVTFSILEDYDKGEDLTEVARDFDLFRELGVTTWRGSFGWDDYEPTRGAYDFEWLHRFASLAASRGITLRPYIGYTPEWAAAGGTDGDVWNDPPRDAEDFYRFSRALAAAMRRHSNIVSYEIYNEENVKQWWDGSPSAYREVLRRGAEGIRAGNPDAQVLFGGMVFPDVDWLEQVCIEAASAPRVDAIPFHAYPETWTPPEVTVENYLGATFGSQFVGTADAACGRRPLWINETGYATVPGRTEADQARWWIRAIATFLAEPRIEHIGIYEIKDLPQDKPVIGDSPNYHLGITRTDRQKKLAFGTLARLVSLVGGQRISVSTAGAAIEGPPAGSVHHHLFTRADGRQALFLWTRTDAAALDVRLPGPATHAVEYTLDGDPGERRELAGPFLRGVALRPNEVRFFEIVP